MIQTLWTIWKTISAVGFLFGGKKGRDLNLRELSTAPSVSLLHRIHTNTTTGHVVWVFLQVKYSASVTLNFALCCGLNGVPPKDVFKSSPLVPVNTTLLEYLVFARCNQVKLRSYWIKTGPNPMAGVTGKFGHGECHMTTEAETGGCSGKPGNALATAGG